MSLCSTVACSFAFSTLYPLALHFLWVVLFVIVWLKMNHFICLFISFSVLQHEQKMHWFRPEGRCGRVCCRPWETRPTCPFVAKQEPSVYRFAWGVTVEQRRVGYRYCGKNEGVLLSKRTTLILLLLNLQLGTSRWGGGGGGSLSAPAPYL